MEDLGIKAIHGKPCTSKAAPEHPKHQVAIISWKTRTVL
ncbi:MAG: hypothetical protein ACI8T1_001262 [Verrucomicrobiales bacterium]|jgi:hypothetical protein